MEILREDPARLQAENPSLLPRSIDVVLIEVPDALRFGGQRAFIEDLGIVAEFHDLVGVSLKAWQPPPPKPVVRDAGDYENELAATSAKAWNPDIKATCERLQEWGKCHKVALVAMMRRPIVLASARLRDRRTWAERASA